MQDLVERSFKINLSLMAILGLYSTEKQSKLFKVRAYCLYLTLTTCVPIFGTLYFVFEENISMTQINNSVFLIAAMVCQIPKLLPFVTKNDRIRRCIYYFEKLNFTLVIREKHKEILDRCSWICRRNAMVYFSSVIISDIFWATRPLFSYERVLPLDVWLPWNLTSQSTGTYFVYLFLVTAVAYTSRSSSLIDPLIGGLVVLATGQLTILKDNLQHINQYAKIENLSDTTESDTKKECICDFIKKCVDHHSSILAFISEFEHCFAFPIFGQFLGSILIIGFCCLQISKVEPLSYNFIANIIFLCMFMTQIYIYCYYGTMLFEESNSLIDAVYMTEWYEYDIKSRNDLIILMERSKRPIIITVGKILNMSVETFMMILKRSYSLLAVLQNL